MVNDGKMYLYVGCGGHRIPGFIHVEINAGKRYKKGKIDPPEILANIAERIPLPDSSVDMVFSRATLEHLTYTELNNHLLECYRILKPGGVVRALVPDFSIMMNDYFHKLYLSEFQGNPNFPVEDYLDEFIAKIYYPDHYYLHNFQTLSKIFEKCGLDIPRECVAGDSSIMEIREALLSSEIGRLWEVIVEAKKSHKTPKNHVYTRKYKKNWHYLAAKIMRFFNIMPVPFVKRKPMFPSILWWREKFGLESGVSRTPLNTFIKASPRKIEGYNIGVYSINN